MKKNIFNTLSKNILALYISNPDVKHLVAARIA